jgi:choline kinase
MAPKKQTKSLKKDLTLKDLLKEGHDGKNCFDIAAQWTGFDEFPKLSKKELEAVKELYEAKQEVELQERIRQQTLSKNAHLKINDVDKDDPTEIVLDWAESELKKAKRAIACKKLQSLQDAQTPNELS